MTLPHLVAIAAAGLLASAAPAPAPAPSSGTGLARLDTVPLYTDLGSHHRRISTRVPAAQQYFDQGLRLAYGFNHAEAIRSFTRAAELDSACAMCYWGIALRLRAARQRADGLRRAASPRTRRQKARRAQVPRAPRERAYIDAVARRYEAGPPADRARLDSAYARAMAKVAKAYPNDLDAATLYAESLMDLRPWNYWTAGRARRTRAPLRSSASSGGSSPRNPNHPGACHYYIHAVEAVDPEGRGARAPSGSRSLMPGEGHMVHMPAHIYIRVGRWNDAVKANQHAIHTDEVFIDGQQPKGRLSPGLLSRTTSTSSPSPPPWPAGARRRSRRPGRCSKVNLDVARQVGHAAGDGALPHAHAHDLRAMGRGARGTAARPRTSASRYAMAYYARGVAHAAKQQWAEAQAALDTVTAITRATPDGAEPKTPLSIAVHALTGEIATRRGDLDAGHHPLPRGARIEDAGLYFEPPKWYYPIRHSLGAALLQAGKAAEAERVYRRRPQAIPRERLGPVRSGTGARGAGENRRGEAGGRALPRGLGGRGREAGRIEVLVSEGRE